MILKNKTGAGGICPVLIGKVLKLILVAS